MAQHPVILTAPGADTLPEGGAKLNMDIAELYAQVAAIPAGAGDVFGPAESIDSEVALFSGTNGKLLKRASATGIASLAAGVLVTVPSNDFLLTATYQALTPVWSGNHTWVDSAEVRLGTGNDLRLFHDGTNSFVRNDTGDLQIMMGATRQAYFKQDGTIYIGPSSPTLTNANINFETAIFFHRNNNPTFRAVAYGSTGTLAAPAALSSGNGLLIIGGGGYDGTAFSSNVTARIFFSTSEPWSPTAHGSRIQFSTNPNGTAPANPATTATLEHNGQWLLLDGTAALPADSYISDPDSGTYRIAANNVGLSTGGTLRWDVSTTAVTSTLPLRGQDGTVALPGSSYTSDPDCGDYRIGPNNVGTAVNGTKILDIATTGLTVTGNVTLGTLGNGLAIKEGANAAMGVATLVLGTATVSNTRVTANSRIKLTGQSLGTVTVPSAMTISTRAAGTSFTILASALTDTSVVAWEIIEPAP